MRATSVATLLLVASAPAARAYQRTETQPGSGIYLFWGPRGHNFQMDALGTPDVSGTVFTSRIQGVSAWSTMKSTRAMPSQPRSWKARPAASATASRAFSVMRAGMMWWLRPAVAGNPAGG